MIRAQHESGTTSAHTPKDARGLRLMQECGYTHVTTDGTGEWRQIALAIRKAEASERVATPAAFNLASGLKRQAARS